MSGEPRREGAGGRASPPRQQGKQPPFPALHQGFAALGRDAAECGAQARIRPHAGGHRAGGRREAGAGWRVGTLKTTHLIAPESAASLRSIFGLEWLIGKILGQMLEGEA